LFGLFFGVFTAFKVLKLNVKSIFGKFHICFLGFCYFSVFYILLLVYFLILMLFYYVYFCSGFYLVGGN